MDQYPDKAPIDLSGVDAVNNIDTARMSLRWALERLRVLEKRGADLEETLSREKGLREKAQAHQRQIEELLALQPQNPDDRRKYREKLDDLVLLTLTGELDVAAIAAREAAISKKEADHRLALERLREEEERIQVGARALADAQAGMKSRLESVREEQAARLRELDDRAREKIVDVERKTAEASDSLRREWMQERAALLVRIEDLKARDDSERRRARELEDRLSAYRKSEAEQREIQQRAEFLARIEDRRKAAAPVQTDATIQVLRVELQEKIKTLEELRTSAEAEQSRRQELEVRIQSLLEAARGQEAAGMEALAQKEKALRDQRELIEALTLKSSATGDDARSAGAALKDSQEQLARLRAAQEVHKRRENELEARIRALFESARRQKAAGMEALAQKEKALRDQRELIETLTLKSSAAEDSARSAGAALKDSQERLARLQNELVDAKRDALLVQASLNEALARSQKLAARVQGLEERGQRVLKIAASEEELRKKIEEHDRRVSQLAAHETARRKKLEEFFDLPPQDESPGSPPLSAP